MRQKGDKAAATLLERVPLGEFDPLRIGWDPLSMLGRSEDEPEWTQWLAALLRLPQSGDVAWRALVSIVDEAAPDFDVEVPELKELKRHWDRARIVAEDYTHDNRRADLVIDHPAAVMLVENKLWDGWHDDSDDRQCDWLSRHARLRAGRHRPPLLVFLAAYRVDERPEVRREGWIFVTWEQLAIELRRQLTSGFAVPPSHINLLPVYLTIGAIEREIMGLRPPPAAHPSWKELENIAKLIEHLEAARAHLADGN